MFTIVFLQDKEMYLDARTFKDDAFELARAKADLPDVTHVAIWQDYIKRAEYIEGSWYILNNNRWERERPELKIVRKGQAPKTCIHEVDCHGKRI